MREVGEGDPRRDDPTVAGVSLLQVPQAPLEAGAAQLSRTALSIVEAAKKILSEQGFSGLTLEAIAAEARVNKSATRYYFGGKAGLIETVLDEIVLQECAQMARDLPADASVEQRVDSFVEHIRGIGLDTSSFGGFFDILPHALRDPALRQRLERLYEVWYEWNFDWLLPDDAIENRQRYEALGRVTAAVIDGIAILASIHGEGYDPEPMLSTLRALLLAALEGEA
jgi:AcrR family transcriptional regulator